MSGGGGGGIIIHKLVESGQFSDEDNVTLLTIADRSVTGCALLDAWAVCCIVWRGLRNARG